ncbi:MAG: glycosyltransferase [Desulfovibrio sp.]|nr:glycosyltransferase [Desulfovibrio sp.]
MRTLYLIHDLSPSSPWVHSTFHFNKAQLAAQDLELGPFNPWTCQEVPAHDFLWRACEKQNQLSSTLKGQLAKINEHLTGSTDVLLFTASPFLERHKGFHRVLHEYTDIGKYAVKTLFILGRPLLALEQRYRESLVLEPARAEKFMAAYGNLHGVLLHAREAYGADNVQLLANLQEDAHTIAAPELAERVYAFLGREPGDTWPGPNLHPLYYQSQPARLLSSAPEVRRNAWPALDEEGFITPLVQQDALWGTDIASPLALRKKFQQESSADQALLEKELGLAAGALDAPQWLREGRQTAADTPVARERVKSFVAQLPEAVAGTLRTRYTNDAPILTGVQRQLLAELEERETGGIKHIGEPEQPVELTVLTMTYNHEEYIEDCLKSVLAQQTEFPVRHIVLDHCSSDATPSILNEYARKHPSIQPVLLSRREPEENVRGLFLRCRTKYAALCDGDDFFSDLRKLQKQVDFLETHENCALCFHPVYVLFEDGHQPFVFPPSSQLPRRSNAEFYLADLTKGNFIQTNSVMYRWRFAEGLPSWFRYDICPADWYWHMLHAEKGRIGFLPEVMGVYRRHGNALYAKSFVDPLAHWRIHGMGELHALKAYNDHFNNRYFRNFSSLADHIFVAYLKIASEEGDSSFLDQASAAYPQFALEFFRNINKLTHPAPAGTQK